MISPQRIILTCLFFVSMVAFSCNKDNQTQEIQGKKDGIHQSISTIQGVPDDVEGCSCLLSRTKEDFQQQKYIYVESYGKIDPDKNLSYISLGGEQIVYPRKQAPRGMQVMVLYDSKQGGKSSIKGSQRTGKLVIKLDNGAILKEDFFGVCGC